MTNVDPGVSIDKHVAIDAFIVFRVHNVSRSLVLALRKESPYY